MTAGIPTTGLSFDLQIRKKGEIALTHVSATAQTADEFAAFPMTLDASIEPTAAQFSAKVSYAVDDVARTMPVLTQFRLPMGYTHAPSPIGVVFPAPQ